MKKRTVRNSTSDIPYTPETWTPEQLACHRADNLDTALKAACGLAGGWYCRAVSIDWQVTESNDERYMLRPSEIAPLEGWYPAYELKNIAPGFATTNRKAVR